MSEVRGTLLRSRQSKRGAPSQRQIILAQINQRSKGIPRVKQQERSTLRDVIGLDLTCSIPIIPLFPSE